MLYITKDRKNTSKNERKKEKCKKSETTAVKLFTNNFIY